jgi:hypothetical protein
MPSPQRRDGTRPSPTTSSRPKARHTRTDVASSGGAAAPEVRSSGADGREALRVVLRGRRDAMERARASRANARRGSGFARTWSAAVVSVPVLSKTTVRTNAARSRKPAERTKSPARRSPDCARSYASGVAIPNAQGHVTMRTAVVTSRLRTEVVRRHIHAAKPIAAAARTAMTYHFASCCHHDAHGVVGVTAQRCSQQIRERRVVEVLGSFEHDGCVPRRRLPLARRSREPNGRARLSPLIQSSEQRAPSSAERRAVDRDEISG